MIFTNTNSKNYSIKFVPYALSAFLIGLVGGFTTVLGPAFVNDLSLPYNNTTWTALSVAVSAATLAPVFGKTADVIGKRKTLLFSLAVFTLGNVLTAFSSSLLFMLISRFVVGIGTAGVAPVVMSFILTEFPKDKIAKGFSIYMLISSAAVIFGPTAGSLIIQYYGWRKMMWLCAAISALVFLICFFTLQKKSEQKKTFENFDTVGAFFIFVFFALILCIPSFAQNFGLNSNAFRLCLIFALFSGTFLFITEKKVKNPILQFSFIKQKVFIFSIIALFLTQGLMQANMTNIIVFVNYIGKENSAISGYAISVMYIAMSLGSIILGPLADKYEPKYILTFSLCLTALGCAVMMLFSKNSTFAVLASSLGVLGFGLGANAAIFMKIVLSSVASEIAGTGTGTYGLFRDLAAPFGVAVFVPMFTNRITSLISLGKDSAYAAVNSIKLLSAVEILCVLLSIITVQFLPKIYKRSKV